jgi:4-hydroxybenzoate polyprenyltransferase
MMFVVQSVFAICRIRRSGLQQLLGLIRTLRPRQWTKNVLIFAGIVFDGQLFIAESFVRILISFLLLCLISGSVYIINDLVDVDSDRQHPVKRNRPIASGQLSIPAARAAAVIFPLLALLGALLMSRGFALIMLTYLILQLLYSFRLKHVVILDVMAVASGFVLRVAAGVFVVPVERFSPWLYGCIALLALFLIIGKRRQEYLELATNAGKVRRSLQSYNLPLLDDMLRMVMTSTLIAYVLYAIESPSPLLAGNNLALLTVPFVLYGMFRYLYLIHVKGEGSAPEEVLLKDRPLQIAILLWGLTFVLILYVPSMLS